MGYNNFSGVRHSHEHHRRLEWQPLVLDLLHQPPHHLLPRAQHQHLLHGPLEAQRRHLQADVARLLQRYQSFSWRSLVRLEAPLRRQNDPASGESSKRLIW